MNKKTVFLIVLITIAVIFAFRAEAVVSEIPISPTTLAIATTSTPAPTKLNAPVVTFKVTDMILGANAFDQYGCQRFSQDATKCLDGSNNKAIDFSLKSIYGFPSPTIYIKSFDLKNGSFGVDVQGKPFISKNGSCVVSDVYYQEIWLDFNQIYDTHVRFTVCFEKEIWYFRFHF